MGDWLVPLLLFLAVALTVVTVVGHGIWVLLAALFGGGEPKYSAPQLRGACPRCGGHLFQGQCELCAWPAHLVSRDRSVDVLNTTREQIDRFSAFGLLEKSVSERLLETLDAERRRLIEQAKAEPAAANVQAVSRAQTVPTAQAVPTAPAPEIVAPRNSAAEPDVLLPDLAAEPLGWPTPQQSAPRIAAAVASAPESFLPPYSPANVAEPSIPRSPRQPLATLLAAFMEEKNIRWGELVGGLLIVCCSIALVISFWAKIAERPFLKFFVFNGVTTALFGLGLHAAHRWKLRSTSRAVLVISILLVPLNFLAIAAFSQVSPSSEALTIAGEVASALLFAGLCYAAGREISSTDPWLLAGGVMLPSIMQLLVRRWISPTTGDGLLQALGAAPIVVYLGVNCWGFWRRRTLLVASQAETSEHISAETGTTIRWVDETLALLGVTTFATFLSLALLLMKTGRVEAALHELAVMVSGFAVTPLVVGLLLWRRLAGEKLVGIRTVGLSIAVAGAAGLVAGVALAWPEPVAMLPTALLVAIALSVVAIAFRLPEAHLPAAACFAIAYLTVWHLICGRLHWHPANSQAALDAFVSGASGQALAPLTALFAAIAGVVGIKFHRVEDGRAYGFAAAACAIASTALVSWFGFGVAGDPLHATWIYAFYALVACVGAYAIRRSGSLWVGVGLILAACAQGVAFLAGDRWPLALPWVAAASVAATLMTLASIAGSRGRLAGYWPHGHQIFRSAALGSSIVAAALLVIASTRFTVGGHAATTAMPLAIHWFWLAVIWLALGPQMFVGFQLALTLATWFAVGICLQRQTWFNAAPYRWLDPWALQAEGIALAVLSLVWIVVRWVMSQSTKFENRAMTDASLAAPAQKQLWRWSAVLNPRSEAADRIVLRAVLVGFVALGLYAAWPGIAQELSPKPGLPNAMVGAGSQQSPAPLASFEFAGISHVHAAGWGSWLLLALIALALAAETAHGRRRGNTGSLVWVLSMACPLAGSWWESQLAVASATRWFAAIYLVVGTALLFVWQRLAGALRTRLAMADTHSTIAESEEAGRLLLFFGAIPALAAALYVIAAAFTRQPIFGPLPDSLFGRIGGAVSYAVPLALVALVLLAHAIHRWSAEFALAAGIGSLVSATTAYLLSLADPNLYLDTLRWTSLLHINAIVAASYAILWVGTTAWARRRRRAMLPLDSALAVQLAIPAFLNVWLLAMAWLRLVNQPFSSPELLAVGEVRGWLAGLLTAAALALAFRFRGGSIIAGSRPQVAQKFGAGLALVIWWGFATLLACTACRWDSGNLLAFHVLLVCHALAGWMLLGGSWLGEKRILRNDRTDKPLALRGFVDRRVVANWSLLGLAVAVGLSFFARGESSPVWWRVGVIASQALLAVALACWALRPGLLYLASALVNVAVNIWLLSLHRPGNLGGFVDINVTALALPGVAWLLLDLWRFRPAFAGAHAAEETPQIIAEAIGPAETGTQNGLPARIANPQNISAPLEPAHRIVARLTLAILAIRIAMGVGACALSANSTPALWTEWLALAATAVAVIACLWDATSPDALAMLYLVGLAAAGVVLDQIHPQPKWLWWTGNLILAAYTVATSYLWSRCAGLWAIGDRLRIPRPDRPSHTVLQWLVPVNCVLVAVVVVLSFGFILEYEEINLRLTAAVAIFAQMVTLGLLARGERRGDLHYGTLLLGVLGAVASGWALLAPTTDGNVLNRAVVAAAAMALMAAVYGLGLAKLMSTESPWLRAAQRMAAWLAPAGLGVLVFVLGSEGVEVAFSGAVTMAPAAILTVVVVLAGLCVASLAAAVLPGRDPLGLSERGRQMYVYGAEVLLALLFVHIRLTKPEWFHGFFEQFWPLIVLGIAFVGVAIGEWFRRRRLLVLGQPLATTGALLPLLPVLGFWILPTRVDYSLLMLAVGLLYSGLAVTRRSFGFGLLAIAATNGSLWYFLEHHAGYRLLEHPQLWMIPPALCVLVASYLNRRQLSATQMTTIRYGASIVIYVSSTADIFLQGVAHAPWLPLVLGGLSLVGILTGILLRVRAFLILGTSFLVLSLLTIIWYAAVDLQQTWLWSATGIATGALILVVFALFEKKRQTVLNVLDQIKQWQP